MSAQPTLSDWLSRKPAGKKPRVAVKKVSERRKREGREYTKLRSEFLNRHIDCMAWETIVDFLGTHINEGKNLLAWDSAPELHPRAVEIHHVRGRVGKMLNDTRHWLALSRWSHDFIHNNPKTARRLKLLA